MEDKVRNLHQACLREERAVSTLFFFDLSALYGRSLLTECSALQSLNIREQVIEQQEILAASRQAAEASSAHPIGT
jgi:hypothetical protein